MWVWVGRQVNATFQEGCLQRLQRRLLLITGCSVCTHVQGKHIETLVMNGTSLLCFVSGGGKGVKDGKGRKKKKAGAEEEEAEEDTYYDAMKKDMGDRAARTKVTSQA